MSNAVTTVPEQDPNAKNVINYNPVFPTMMAQIKLELPTENMAQELLQLAVDTENYEGGYTTYFNGQTIDHIKGIKELKEAIYGVSVAYCRELKFDLNPDRCGINVWANVMRKGGHHGIHNHPRSVVSGTFYVKAEEDHPPIVFINPTSDLRMHEPIVKRPEDFTAFTSPTLMIQPKPNDMLIWPSWINHHVPKSASSSPRISISFNVDFLPPGA